MISTPDRRETVELIETAMAQGTRQDKACEMMGLSVRTYQRWTQQGGVEADQRPLVQRQAPTNN
jgi:putative transposase